MIDTKDIPGLEPGDFSDIAAVMDSTDLTFRALVRVGKLDPRKDFRRGDFCGMPLYGQDIRGFDFTGSDLRETGIEDAIIDETTILTGAIFDGGSRLESDNFELDEQPAIEAASSQVKFLNRQALYLRPDPARVVVRPSKSGPLDAVDTIRANGIADRVLALDPKTTARQLADVLASFEGRHRDLLAMCEARADEMEDAFAPHAAFTRIQRQLVGAYFLREYSFESSALFNPSIVPHPDQSGTPEGGRRFIMSFRAIGEGHVSSLTFRSGYLEADGSVNIDPTTLLASGPIVTSRRSGTDGDDIEVIFKSDAQISERVILPITLSQSNGIEDARFVEFEDGGRKTFYATYTASSGTGTRSELIETADFVSFRMSPLRGSAARNKEMALFPRKIGGRYAMIGRQDNENLCLIYSDDVYSWDRGVAILKPQFPWEFAQIGNCGSPLELDEGWLLLTYGVGPIGTSSIGAVLLDKGDPSKVLARSREPLVRPEPTEREGYVPNVVYTCGAMRHNDQIVLPYAVSDTFSNFATFEIAELMRSLGR